MSLTIQKANFWKRISAYLFDVIIAIIVTVGVATVLSAALGYSKQTAKLNAYRDEYVAKYEAIYEGVDFDIKEEDYNKLSKEEQKRHDEAVKACNEAINKDENVLKVFQTLFFMILVIVSISILLGILIVQFIVPLFFKNGQTLGKKIFGVALMRSNYLKISNFVLFVRSIFGLYTIETMFPVALIVLMYFNLMGIVGTVTIGLLLLLQLGVLFGTKNHAAIHDLLADTVVVDYASQRIFATEQEMLAYKQTLHEEEAAKRDYV